MRDADGERPSDVEKGCSVAKNNVRLAQEVF